METPTRACTPLSAPSRWRRTVRLARLSRACCLLPAAGGGAWHTAAARDCRYEGAQPPGARPPTLLRLLPKPPSPARAAGVYQQPAATAGNGEFAAYQPSPVTRTTLYKFYAGGWVYQLTDPEGQTYWMQSYSTEFYPWDAATLQDVDATRAALTELPAGWEYDAFVIFEKTPLVANGTAYVLSDQVGGRTGISGLAGASQRCLRAAVGWVACLRPRPRASYAVPRHGAHCSTSTTTSAPTSPSRSPPARPTASRSSELS